MTEKGYRDSQLSHVPHVHKVITETERSLPAWVTVIDSMVNLKDQQQIAPSKTSAVIRFRLVFEWYIPSVSFSYEDTWTNIKSSNWLLTP